MNRRTFLELSAAGGLAQAGISLAAGQAGTPQPNSIENRFFRVVVDPAKGVFSAWRGGRQLLLNTHAAASGRVPFDLSNPRYNRSASAARINDAIGAGHQLVLSGADTRKEADLELRLAIYDDLDALFAEIAVLNPSAKPLPVSRLEPVRAQMDELGALLWNADRILTNGYIYYDPGEMQDYVFTSRRSFESFWNIALHDSESRRTLVIGSIENIRADTKVAVMRAPVAVWDQSIRGLSLTVTCALNRTFELPPGALVASGKVMVHADEGPFRALEQYASTYAKAAGVKLNPIINGWCSWFYTHTQVTEDEVLKNAEFVARRLKPFGMTVVQIDDGYYRAFGDWEGNERFPHGMKWLADRIRQLGLTPGLWLAPYVIRQGTEVAGDHPEFLVRGLGE